MGVQGYVSLQKSIGSLAEDKAALTRGPRDTAATSGSALIKQLRLFTLSNIPFQRISRDALVAPALMCFTLAESSEELGNLVGSPQHEIFMSILDGN